VTTPVNPRYRDGGPAVHVVAEPDGGALPPTVDRAPVHTGAMVALVPSDADAQRLAVDGGEPVDELHCTLMFLGEAVDVPDTVQTAVVNAVRAYVDGWPPVEADGFAVSLFNPGETNDRPPCVVLGLSGDEVDIVHEVVGDAVAEAVDGSGWAPPEQHMPWTAHVTLVYPDGADTAALGQMVAALADQVGPVTFDRVRVAFGDQVVDIPLDGPPPAPLEPDTEPVAAAAAFVSHMPPQLARYWIRRIGPWGHGSFARCVRQIRKHYPLDPEGTCANLHKEATGKWPGEKNHTTTGTADFDSAPEATMTMPTPMPPQGDCPPGQHQMPDGTCMDDEPMAAAPADQFRPTTAPTEGELAAQPGEHFHTWVEEGVSTGWREFALDATTWRDPPFAYHEMVDSSAHGGQARVVQRGRITRGMRVGPIVHWWGQLDLKDPDAAQHGRKIAEGWVIGTSVGPDESVRGKSVEYVWPESDGEDGGLIDILMGTEAERMIFHDYNVAEITGVSVPALADAKIEPTQELLDELAALGVLTAAAVGSHSTGTADGTWDKGANEKRLPSPVPVATARKVYAWVDDSRVEDGAVPKDACKFPHHNVSADGTPGAANLTACSTAIGSLHEGRGATPNIPDSDRRSVYNHVRKHLLDGGRDPDSIPDFEAAPIVAAGYTITIPDCPPAWWFTEPVDVTPHGALTITDEGRIYGYVAPAGVAHRSFPGRRVEVPMGRVDYNRWMGGEALVADGGRVPAGPITMECGHLPPAASSNPAVRMEHYDNACAVVAKAVVGENQHGVWIAGALEPSVTADQVSRMLACRLSGDWAPHPERPGWTEFVAALLVPVPGFPMARSAPSVRVTDGALVAAAVPVRLVSATTDVTSTPDGADLRPALERLARGIRRDTESRMSALRDRVHAGGR
jgi:2'-5' RNA ligase